MTIIYERIEHKNTREGEKIEASWKKRRVLLF